jgi:biotin carboxyl carrier protein
MKYFANIGDDAYEYRFERRGQRLLVHGGPTGAARDHELDVALVGDGSAFSLLIDGRSYDVLIERTDGAMVVQLRGERIAVAVADERERAAHQVHAAAGGGLLQLNAAMPGVVADVLVKPGDRVESGQTLVVLEAMKMQNPLMAEAPGVVRAVLVEVGQAVAGGALLVEVDRG